MKNLGEHAIVIGASMGGLLAARVLSDFFTTVTVLERDGACGKLTCRARGVPQGRHTHGAPCARQRDTRRILPRI
ncbi:NAD(P)-binding protein [Paraburkholderia dipogonis]|uniref:NAD(P)-binding protein n=1 Tax=Paraburkholderia dipogonis TaxID=1211383 RepID=UPI0035EB4F7C